MENTEYRNGWKAKIGDRVIYDRDDSRGWVASMMDGEALVIWTDGTSSEVPVSHLDLASVP